MSLRLVLLAALLPLAACTTLQPLADVQAATIRQAVQPGDSVELARTDGSQLALKVEQVTETELVGVGGGKRYTVPLADIRSLGVRSMTTQDKIWTAVAIVGAVGVAVAAAGGGSGSGGGGDGPGY